MPEYPVGLLLLKGPPLPPLLQVIFAFPQCWTVASQMGVVLQLHWPGP